MVFLLSFSFLFFLRENITDSVKDSNTLLLPPWALSLSPSPRENLFLIHAYPVFFFFLWSFLLLAAPWHMEFPDQGLNPSPSWNLPQLCNVGSLTHCARPGIEPTSLLLQRYSQSHCTTAGTPGTPHFIGHHYCILQINCIFYKPKVCGNPVLSDDS